MTPWILCDVSFLAHRAFHSVGNLQLDDVPTGVIFGFFHQLRDLCLDPHIRSSRIALFRDSRTSKRRDVYPKYKLRRETERTTEEISRYITLREQIDTLTTDVLPKIGFPIYHQEGLESDDLMAFAAQRLGSNGTRQAVMVTADGDLFQSITQSVHWFDPQRRIYHTPVSFRDMNGIGCDKWGEVKALSGCHSDNVKGIPGVGRVTAIKYLNGDLPASHKTHHSIVSLKGKEIIKRNRELVVLPHKETTPFELKEPKIDVGEFFAQCERFGLVSIIEERVAWTSFLKGTPFKTRKRRKL